MSGFCHGNHALRPAALSNASPTAYPPPSRRCPRLFRPFCCILLRLLQPLPARAAVLHCPLDRWARFGPRFANAARCTISQVPSCGGVAEPDDAKQEAHGGKPEVGVALRVDVASAEVLTQSDQEDIRAQVAVSWLFGSRPLRMFLRVLLVSIFRW